MHRLYRHRRRKQNFLGERRGSPFRAIVGALLLAILLLSAGSLVLKRYDAGNTLRRSGAALSIEAPATVNVSIEGSELRRAEDGQKLYPGDRVTTGAASHAVLSLFDGTTVRLDEGSDVRLEEHVEGRDQSEVTMTLAAGRLWVSVPSRHSFSGSVVRRIETPAMALTLPAETEAVLALRSLSVFSADGLGVSVEPHDGADAVFIGEGQKFTLPPNLAAGENLYVHRSPLDPLAVGTPFLEESRNRTLVRAGPAARKEDAQVPAGDKELLSVTSPQNDLTVDTATIEIAGRAGPGVEHVRANGYALDLDPATRTFRQELSLPDQEEIDITVVALNDEGDVLADIRRHIRREIRLAVTPKITSPAAAGQTYRTQRERILIEGETAPDTVGIVVNNYRLQLFNPGDGVWRYLAALSMGNLRPGRNVYEVRAINRSGEESEEAMITILLQAGEEGIVEEEIEEIEEMEDGEDSEESGVRPLPGNDPTAPGTLSVTSPADGSEYTATEAFLIEGTTSSQTHSVWVNGYRLQLYEPGKTFWNYIADPELQTLQKGRNVYRVTARDREGMILDTLRYIVRF